MSNSIKEFKEVFKNCKINEYGNIILPDTNQCLTCGRFPEDLLTVKENYLLKNNKRLLKKIRNTLTGRNITENEMKDILSQAFILETVDNTDTSSKEKLYRLSSLLHVGTYLINVKEDLSLCYPGNYSKSNKNVFNHPGRRHLTEDECRKFKPPAPLVSGAPVTKANIEVGLRVKRGPDWKYKNQDGGGVGTITSFDAQPLYSGARLWASVKWDNGSLYRYRFIGPRAAQAGLIPRADLVYFADDKSKENFVRGSFKEYSATNPLTCNGSQSNIVVNSISDCTAKLKQIYAQHPGEYLFGSYFDVRGIKTCRYGTGITLDKAKGCGKSQPNVSNWGGCNASDIQCYNMILNPKKFTKWGKTYDWPDGCIQDIDTKDVYFAPSSYKNNRWPLLKGTKEKDKKNIISKAIQLCSTDKTASSSKCSIEFGKENCPPLIRRLVNKSNAPKFIIQESDFSIQNIVVNKDDLEDTESKLYKFIKSNNLSHSIVKENYYDSFIQYIKLNKLLLRDTKHSHKLDKHKFKMKMDSLLSVQKKNKEYPKLISNINKGVDVIRDEYEKNKDMIDTLQNKKQMNIRNSLLSLDTYNKTERVRYFIKVFSIIFSIVITLYFLYLCFKKKIQVSKSSMVLFLVILLLIILGIIFI